ncbi:NAD(P)-dependent oxidoreductase (plasmid) [Sphingomonas paeninsulae]|uniref:NAD(P)-dependent oxidoreductase n=1 Tax=Sphingomonas paeninsulae TaxID=2319844 RepID=A0A494T7C6_SPHPE|nr:NAD(P)-dependent oxidoreductase [Sphingomonas paeninsulae]AYJ85279.1 NAD(P)-dependent oxidoreductase [Sphingomonas paeninsulae]
MSGVTNPAIRDRSRVGFIGLGNQGAPIAERIARADYDLTLWARRPESLQILAGKAKVAGSITELAASVDILCICVVDDAGVRDVCDAALVAMTPGSMIAIVSTVHPDTCRSIGKAAALRRIAVIDAPVSGGAIAALAGTLTVMMGGSQADCARFAPLAETFASLVVRLGEIGSGQAAKLINNALLTANLMLAHEAAFCGSVLGLESAALSRVIAASSGNSEAHAILSRLPDLQSFAHGARLLAKDVDLFAALLTREGGTAEHIVGEASAFLSIFDPASSDPKGTP